jgi:chromosome segregation ATPase
MAKPRKTAHAQLDQLRQQAAAERVKAHNLEAQLEAAKVEIEDASRAVTDAYAAEDARLAQQRRKQLEAAEAKVIDLGHQVTAAAQRVERARRQLDEFQRHHARDLLDEREQPARTVAAELTASVHETIRLANAYIAERTTQDRLVACVPGATPRVDGPPALHPWERQLKDLERAAAEVSECPPPLPSWWGLNQRRAEDATARRLQLQRRKKLTQSEQDELDRLNRDRVIPPAVAVVRD